MLVNLYRDAELMPTVQRSFSRFADYVAGAQQTLMAGRPLRGRARERVRAATGHALAFATWRSLARDQGLDDAAAAELMCRLVSGRLTHEPLAHRGGHGGEVLLQAVV